MKKREMINRLLIIPFVLFFVLFFVLLFWVFNTSKSEFFTPISIAFSDNPNNFEYSDYKKQLYSNKDLGSGTINVVDMNGNPVSLPPPEFSREDIRYDPNKYDVEYHVNTNNELYDSQLSNIQVLDLSGNLIKLPYAKTQGLPVYYDIQAYPNGIPNRTPNYLETVVLESR